MKLLVFPQGWFTASESKIPSATLMSLVKQGLLKLDSSTKPNKYLVNSNSTDIFLHVDKKSRDSFDKYFDNITLNINDNLYLINDLGFVSPARRYEAPMCCTPGASK